MTKEVAVERFETVVVGGGQAGLSVGYHLARIGRPFVILEANDRIGDCWRNRWDSLRLFTPARYDGLPGMPFPADAWSFPTRDQMADYLTAYAARFDLPVRTGIRVDTLARRGDRYCVASGERMFEADNVVVASGPFLAPRLPNFAPELNPDILQLHSSDYRNPSQLKEGDVLVVGAGNSGADLGLEASRAHRTWLSGRHPGQIPWRIEARWARVLNRVVFFVFSHVLTVKTPIGRKVRPNVVFGAGPLIRVKLKDIEEAGIERVPRTVGVKDGAPMLADGRVLDVANVIWCTGFRPNPDWIDLPVFGEDGEPVQTRGILSSQPGLYFVGREFLYAFSSAMVHGVGRDAEHVVKHIALRRARSGTAEEAAPLPGLAAASTGASLTPHP
jgi:putative flavoprotein involved in K+ transport